MLKGYCPNIGKSELSIHVDKEERLFQGQCPVL